MTPYCVTPLWAFSVGVRRPSPGVQRLFGLSRGCSGYLEVRVISTYFAKECMFCARALLPRGNFVCVRGTWQTYLIVFSSVIGASQVHVMSAVYCDN